jgi:hypothetical protein
MEISDDSGFSDLPRVIPVFPLTGALLLPGGNLPLHLFEPRYREMVRDALASNRMIGMIQPRNPDTQTHEPDLYDIGCVGKIAAFRETDDGRFYISLRGQCRFAVLEEVPSDKLYRTVLVNFADYRADMLPADDDEFLDRDVFTTSLRSFFELHEVNVEWETVEQVPDGALVRSLAMTCPFEPNEKQALPEAGSAAERGRMVSSLIEMALRQPGERPQLH